MITALIVLSLTFGLLIVLPLMIVGLILKVGLAILLLPFKLLGGAVRLILGLTGLFFHFLFGVAGFVGFVLACLAFLFFLPALPFLLVGAIVWLACRGTSTSLTARTAS